MLHHVVQVHINREDRALTDKEKAEAPDPTAPPVPAFKVGRTELLRAATYVAKVAPKRPSVPVLAGVLIQAFDGGDYRIDGFDFEQWRCYSGAGADVTTAGTVLVSAERLVKMLTNLKGDTVEIWPCDGARVALVSGTRQYMLGTMPVLDYPQVPTVGEHIGHVLLSELAEGVQRAAVAAGRDDTLPVLQGVEVQSGHDVTQDPIVGTGHRSHWLRFLTTDRYRAVEVKVPWAPIGDKEHTMLPPAAPFAEAVKAIAKDEEHDTTVTLWRGEGVFGFAVGRYRWSTRLIDGKFPNLSDIAEFSASRYALRVNMEPKPLIERSKAADVIAVRSAPIAIEVVRTDDGGHEVYVVAGSPESDDGYFIDSLPVGWVDRGTYVGDHRVFADGRFSDTRKNVVMQASGRYRVLLNSALVRGAMTAVGTPTVRLRMTDPRKPVIFEPAPGTEPEGVTLRYLLMPVRDQEGATPYVVPAADDEPQEQSGVAAMWVTAA